jgi:integrase
MLTLGRRNDVASARWDEIDLTRGTWTIPASRFKSGRAHVIPLAPQALAVLKEAAGLPGGADEIVFPSPLHPEPKPGEPPRSITPSALTRALTRTLSDLDLPHGSPHDFRRAGATTLTGESYGFRRFVVGLVLGHSVQDGAAVTSVYDRNEYLVEKRAALNAWAAHVAPLPKPKDKPEDSNVLQFAPAVGA